LQPKAINRRRDFNDYLVIAVVSFNKHKSKVGIANHNSKSLVLCQYPEDYKYSSAKFYEKNEKDWVFLSHDEG
jgi:hypothetical protein